MTRFRPASVKQTLSPRSSIQPRATATAIASFVRSFDLVGNPHQRHSPSVARYIARTRNRAALSFWSSISNLRFPVSSRCWGQVVSWDARLTPGRLFASYSDFGVRHAGGAQWHADHQASRAATGRRPVTLAFLWCSRNLWEIDQAQLDNPPWSGSRQLYRCPGCGGRVERHIHGPAWRPGYGAAAS